jgi:hypothetical protein
MSHPYHHALSSAKKWGGKPEDYQKIHDWFDASKAFYADWRHRALRHHAEGIFMCETLFGTTITNSLGQQIPVRLIGEQHVREDLGRIPSVQDWLSNITSVPWMRHTPKEDPEPELPSAKTPNEVVLTALKRRCELDAKPPQP